MNKSQYYILQTLIKDYQDFHALYIQHTALGAKKNISSVEKLRGELSKASKGLEIRAKLWKELLEGPKDPQVEKFLLDYELKEK